MVSFSKKPLFWVVTGLAIFGLIVFGVYRFLQPPIGRTNFLVLGVAGGTHAGSDLTDTVMFVSVENQTGKALLLSLPRDIWIAALRTKLNSVYHYRGLAEAKKTASEILGQPVDYGIVVDFNIFTEIIDNLGGVEVEVSRSFDDDKYPLAGKENDECSGDPEYKCRYERLHFEAGKQLMNGEIALKYVRSRNAEGEEGTDFARSQRQQRLILAIKNKIFSPPFLLDLRKPLQLFKVVSLNVKTDIPKEKYLDFFKIALRFKTKNLKTEVLNGNYLVNPPTSKEKYDNQWVLVPKNGGWEAVREYVWDLLKD